jgi:oligosaccharide translocation protein RFT1
LCWLSLNLFVQSIVKHVLTHGDSVLIASLASLRDQGAWALASNYGGLIARMLFQPIEESSRNLFGKLGSNASRDHKNSKANASQAKTTLQDILKFYSILSVLIVAFGPYAAPLLLRIVAGARWSDTEAGNVLATYCFYIPFLAFNGVAEAFVAAVATNSQLWRQNVFMAVFSAIFAAAVYVFLVMLKLGAKGVIYANCINMGLRICWGLYFIKSYFSSRNMVSNNPRPSRNLVTTNAKQNCRLLTLRRFYLIP